jgi:hypothetical protein
MRQANVFTSAFVNKFTINMQAMANIPLLYLRNRYRQRLHIALKNVF